MLISHKWLKKYIPDLDELSKAQIGETLSLKLAEVERIIPIRQELKGIVSGEIMEVERIEGNDKLSKCKVKISDNEISDIICGAPNVKKDMKVAVCLPGGSIYDPGNREVREITSKSVHGITSNGMICSEKELGISDEHEGIMELETEMPIGTDLLPILQDHVYEIENKSLGHRPDCFSHEGIAREICAILNLNFNKETQEQPLIPSLILPLEVMIKAPEDQCIRFVTIILSDIKVHYSPLWLKALLASTGIRSVNNVVDSANYIMLDKGQPLHTYDYDKITSNKLIIRMGKNNEVINAIDGKEYKINDKMLVISNGNSIDDIAGIMGGKSSEITNETKNIIIEAANFNMYSIRRTSRELGLRSEASTRFEKGQDPEKVETAIKQAVHLILDLAQGEIASEMNDQYPKKSETVKIELDLVLVRRFLGIELPVREIINYFDRLGLIVEDEEKIMNITGLPENNLPVTVIVPSFRRDLKIQEDLLEEIARLYGYDRLIPTLPQKDITAVIPNKGLKVNRKVGGIMRALGYDEIYSYSFVGQELYSRLGLDIKECLKIVNPLSPDLSYFRNSLIPSLIEKLEINKKNYNKALMYEIGRIVYKKMNEESGLHAQPLHITGIYWDKESNTPFFDSKAVIEKLSQELVLDLTIEPMKDLGEWKILEPLLHKGRTGVIKIKEEVVGIISEIHPKLMHDIELVGKASIFELDLSKITEKTDFKKEYSPISSYQSIKRDLSFYVNNDILFSNIIMIIKGINDPYLKDIELLDIFEPKDMQGKKSMTISIKLQSDKETLKDEEINGSIDKVIEELEKQIKASFRKNIT